MPPDQNGPSGEYYSPPPDTDVGGLEYQYTSIDEHYLAIMQEDLEAYSRAADMWRASATALDTLHRNLSTRAETLREGWPSGEAQRVFMEKVDETRRSLENWRDAASSNATTFTTMHGALSDAKPRMEALYDEYEAKAKAAAEDDANGGLFGFEIIEDVTDIVGESRHGDIKKEYTLRSRSEIMDGVATALSQGASALQRGRVYQGPKNAAPVSVNGPGGPGAGPGSLGALSHGGNAPGAPPRPPGDLMAMMTPGRSAFALPAPPRPPPPPALPRLPAGALQLPPRPAAPPPLPPGLGGLMGRPAAPTGLNGLGANGLGTRPGAPTVPSGLGGGGGGGRPAAPPGLPPGLSGRNGGGGPGGGLPPGAPPGSRPTRPQLNGRGGGGAPPGAPPLGRGAKPPGGPLSGRPGGPGGPGAPALPGRGAGGPKVLGKNPPGGPTRPGVPGPGMPGSGTPPPLRGTRGTPKRPLTGRPGLPGELRVPGGPGLGGRRQSLRPGQPETVETTRRALRPGLDGRGLAGPGTGAGPAARPGGPPARQANRPQAKPAAEATRAMERVGDEELFTVAETAPAVIERPVEKQQAKRPGPALGVGR